MSKLQIEINCDKQGGTCGKCQFLQDSLILFGVKRCKLFNTKLKENNLKIGRCNECIWADDRVTRYANKYQYFFLEAMEILKETLENNKSCPICHVVLSDSAHDESCKLNLFFEEEKQWIDSKDNK